LTTLNDIQKAHYVALESFRKSGEGVITPVWQAPENGKLYVWTAGNSWKVKRIRNNPHVRICASDYKGTPKSDWVNAQARILQTPNDEKTQHRRMAAKYGWQFWLFYLVSKLQPGDYVVLEISFDK
jgi:PPOX class probable F420-dependent enzyme